MRCNPEYLRFLSPGRGLTTLLLIAAIAACSPEKVAPTPAGDTAADAQVDAAEAGPGTDAVTSDASAETQADAPDADSFASDAADGSDGLTGDVEPDGVAPDQSTDPDVAPDSETPDVADSGDTAPDSADTAAIGKTVHNIACTTPADCKIPCANGICTDGKCKYSPVGNACVVAISAEKVGCYGPGDTSDEIPCLACAPALNKVALSSVTALLPLDGGPADNLQIVDTAKGGIVWSINDKRAISGGKSLYFGQKDKYTYANEKTVGATAKLQPLSVPSFTGVKPKLVFWLWLDTEQTPGDDLLTVSAITAEETKVLWTSDAIGGTTNKVWQRIQVDVSAYAGKAVPFQFGFATSDSHLNAFEGAWIDDVAVTTGCCGAAADCDDGNACSSDTCASGEGGLPVCTNAVKAACCNSGADCDDKQPCTLDLCSGQGGTCTTSPKPGCCLKSEDCNDDSACTVDTCPFAGGQCSYSNTCCKSDAECDDKDECTADSCVSGQCVATSTCCNKDNDCDDFNPCTKDACSNGKCVFTGSNAPGCCTPSVLTALFNGSAEGFVGAPLQNGIGWHYKATAAALSAPGVLAFGDPTKETFSAPASGVKKAATVSPFITLLSGKEATLTLQLRNSFTSSWSLRIYTVLDTGEATLATLQYFSFAQNQWIQHKLDLTPLAGKSFQLYFEMSPATFGNLNGSGVFLDDIKVESTCQAKKCTAASSCPTTGLNCLAGVCSDGICSYANSCCTANSDCNDNSLCTSDTCGSNKKCTFAAIPSCCMGNGDCNDSNGCTLDTCPGPGGKCSFSQIGGCCLSSSQCDDKVACTQDACLGNKCVNKNTCCTADKDCDDNDKICTTEKCVSSVCVYTQTNAPGCCQPQVFYNDFDTGVLKDIAISNGAGPDNGWQLWGSALFSKSGKGVLYYGNINKQNFEFGASKGTATLPKITLPATASTLTFWLYMDTEGGSFDNLIVNLTVNGAKSQAFNKSSSGFPTNQWKEVKIDLTAHAGKELQVELLFDTIDSIGNSGKGVFVDDLLIQTKCN